MNGPDSPMPENLSGLLSRASDQRFELAFIKASGSYRLAERLRTGKLARAARRFRGEGGGLLTVRPLGKAGAGKGPEVWLLRVSSRAGEPGIPWGYVERRGLVPARSDHSAHGACLQGASGFAAARVSDDPELVFMTHPWSGLVEVEFAGRRQTLDLFSAETGTVVLRPARPQALQKPETLSAPAPSPQAFTPADREFIARCAADTPEIVAIHCPRWLGISAATRTLFEHRYAVPETPALDPAMLDDVILHRHARVLAECGVTRFVISGGDRIHRRLIDLVHALKPGVVFDVLWHGSYYQIADNYEWEMLRTWIDAAKTGAIRGVATVKAGMEDFLRARGVVSALILNYVPGTPLAPPELPEAPIHAGIWISGAHPRKNPHSSLCALSMLGGVVLHAAGLDQRAQELVGYLGLTTAGVEPRPLPPASLLEAIRRTLVSLYVTFSECCPMLPLESLKMGVPCLVGPVSHLFEDCPYLFERLVVPFPDRADVIARYTRRAVEERHGIITAWTAHAPEFNRKARESVARFIAEGPTR